MFDSLRPSTSSNLADVDAVSSESDDESVVINASSSDEWTPGQEDRYASDGSMTPVQPPAGNESDDEVAAQDNGSLPNIDRDANIMVSRDETEWFYDEPANRKTPIRNIVRQCRSAYSSDVSTPVEATELFLDNDILNIIVECTNKEGHMAFGKKKSECVDTDRVEIQAFLATLLSLGSMKQGMID